MPIDSTSLANSLGRLDAQRKQTYQRHLRFFEGQQWDTRLRRGPHDRQLVFNYVRAVVEKSASFVLTGMKSVVVEAEEEADHPALVALREQYELNGVDLLDFDSEVDCSVLGDGAFRVTWDVDAGRTVVTAPDVQQLYAWPVPGDFNRVWRVAHAYTYSDEQVERFLTRRPEALAAGGTPADETAPQGRMWAAQPRGHKVVEVWTDESFELFLDGRLFDAKPNPYGWVPYVVYPNVRLPKQFYGESDLVAMLEPQRELNRALSQLSMILELSGNPIAVLEAVTAADVAVRPGAVWTLPEGSKAYLLDLLAGGGVDLHTKFVEVLYRTLHDLGETPRQAFGEADAALSGVAIELQFDPLIKKAERKRRIRAQAFRRRDEMVLRLLTQFAGGAFEGVRTRIEWGPLLPSDRSREVADEVQLVTAGIHAASTAATLLGSDDGEAEFARVLAERRQGAVPALQGSRAGIREVV